MTPLEMNVKIAKILGLTVAYVKNGIVFVADKHGHPKPVNYTTDKALCWDLMEKLLQAGWDLWYFEYDKIYKWRKYDAVKHKDIITYDKSLLLATCETFIEEHK